MKKILKYFFSSLALLCLLYFFPVFTILFALCGIYDVSRNTNLDFSVAKQYFAANGVLTWLASPLNVLFDILSLPFINKGVYKLEDLPSAYQSEIIDLIDTVNREDLIEKLEKQVEGLPRAMFFFKWYGKNVPTSIEIKNFQKHFRYVRTIGVSVFKQRESTSRHFGPFRATFRVLYSISDVTDDDVYIKVGKYENHWKNEKLFIFDDTLLHQSFNESDNPRYVLFVDVLRPSYLNFFFDFIVTLTRIVFKNFNGIFYKKWKMVNN